ncbi:MAG: hypothetical protein Kow0090_21020 [Myxococcota bacterium]
MKINKLLSFAVAALLSFTLSVALSCTTNETTVPFDDDDEKGAAKDDDDAEGEGEGEVDDDDAAPFCEKDALLAAEDVPCVCLGKLISELEEGKECFCNSETGFFCGGGEDVDDASDDDATIDDDDATIDDDDASDDDTGADDDDDVSQIYCPTGVELTGEELPCDCGGEMVEALPGSGICYCDPMTGLVCETPGDDDDDDNDDVTPPGEVEVCDGADNDGNGTIDDVVGENGGFDGVRETVIPGGSYQSQYGTMVYSDVLFTIDVHTRSPSDADVYMEGNSDVTINHAMGTNMCHLKVTIVDKGGWSGTLFKGAIMEALFCCPNGITVNKITDITSIEFSGSDFVCGLLNNQQVTGPLKSQILQQFSQPVGNCN